MTSSQLESQWSHAHGSQDDSQSGILFNNRKAVDTGNDKDLSFQNYFDDKKKPHTIPF